MSLAGIILTKNEKANLKECVESLLLYGEVIVIDDFSTDNTVQIAKKLGARVYKRYLNGDFAAQRNFALSKATSEWVLFVDADERVTPELQKEIKEAIKDKSADGFMLKRQDIWLGKHLKNGEFGETCLLRLGRRKKGKWMRSVHEHWLIEGNVKTLKHPLLHYPHPTVARFISEINFYAKLHGEENKNEGKNVSLIKLYLYPIAKFGVNFFVKKGYKDGVHGFVAAILMSFHSYLAWHTLWYQKQIGSKSN